MFIGRKKEINLLNEYHFSGGSEFCVLYGRRRIGKSTLLEEFAKDKSSFFFLAGRESKRLQLKRFVRELGEAVGDPLTGKVNVSEWDEALTLLDRNITVLSERNKGKKAIVIFDEFQWMCRGAPELLSDLQRFWDKKWKNAKNLFLILCGSSISFMLGDVLSRKSPLFGRRTVSFELTPFKAKEASAFLSGRNSFEIAEAYMAVGGVPKYFEILNSKGSIRKHIARQAFSSTGFLYDEIRFVLSEQLKETEHYFMLLEQMAYGAKAVVEMEKATGIASGQIMYYLERLRLLGFVSRHTPLGESIQTKRVRYRLDDYYLRFYFTFIHPNYQSIPSLGDVSFDTITKDKWAPYAGIAFEHFVHDHSEIVVEKSGYEGAIKQNGSYWQYPTKRKQGFQIDLLIECQDKTTLVCECKWSRKKTGMDAVTELRKNIELYPNLQRHTLKPVIVASGGVTKTVLKEKDIAIVTLEDFFPK